MRRRWRTVLAATLLVVALAGWGAASVPWSLTATKADGVVERPPAPKLAVSLDVPLVTKTAVALQVPPAPPPPPPVEAEGFLAADVVGSSIALHDGPGGAAVDSMSNPQPYGVALTFHVIARQGDWLHVHVPTRPNGRTAWISAADVSLRPVPNRVVAEVGARRVTVYQGATDRVLFQAPVAVGAPSTPTPIGDGFYVDEIRATSNPDGVYGPYQMRISAFSEVLFEFNGGPGQVAFHGTNAPGLIGSAVSNGCLRMYNSDIVTLVNLAPKGTPVSILP